MPKGVPKNPTVAKKRGRKPQIVTDENRRRVVRCLAGGMSCRQTAIAMKMSLSQLQRLYPKEIETALSTAKDRLLELLWEQAEAGKIPAITRLMDRNDKAAALAAFQSNPAPTEPARKEPAKERLGKKEERAIAAASVAEDGLYATPAPPRLVVNNA